MQRAEGLMVFAVNNVKAYRLATSMLKLDGIITVLVNDSGALFHCLRHTDLELLILEASFDGFAIRELLPAIKALCPELNVVVISTHGDAAEEMFCRGLGVVSYVLFPEELPTLPDIVVQAVLQKRNARIRDGSTRSTHSKGVQPCESRDV